MYIKNQHNFTELFLFYITVFGFFTVFISDIQLKTANLITKLDTVQKDKFLSFYPIFPLMILPKTVILATIEPLSVL